MFFRKRGKERKIKKQHERETSVDCLTGDQTHNLGICADQEYRNQTKDPSVQDGAPTN